MDPQKPGRKVGQGKFEGRQAPSEEDLSSLEEVVVHTEVCACGGELEGQGFEFVSVTELPAIPKAVIKGYRVEIKGCKCCGKKYRGRHNEIAEDQYGAPAVKALF